MFVDDCIIYQSGDTWDTVQSNLQFDLNNIIKWTESNFLTLNRDKTQSMIIGLRFKLSKWHAPKEITINGEKVNFVKQYSYLGILLDNEMFLQPMLKQVKKSLTNKVYSLRRISKYINDRAAISIYKQTILPIIDYSGFLLLSCSHGDQCDLQKIQNDVLRIC